MNLNYQQFQRYYALVDRIYQGDQEQAAFDSQRYHELAFSERNQRRSGRGFNRETSYKASGAVIALTELYGKYGPIYSKRQCALVYRRFALAQYWTNRMWASLQVRLAERLASIKEVAA